MALDDKFVNRIKAEFPSDCQEFLNALEGEPITSIRLNGMKVKTCSELEQVPWCEGGRYLKQRPVFTLDPLFHAGAYYVQEASSMFVERFFNEFVTVGVNTKVLDLCASPGGKSTHLASMMGGKGLLVSNEVVKTRVAPLRENLTKWGFPNVVVTNSEPSVIGKCEGFFDVILVDAPCSGEGMFRKDMQAVTEWSEENVKMCADRQRGILSDIYPALKEGGVLIYSTCTYNRDEDEDILNWICNELGGEKLVVPFPADWGIVGGEDGLHFYPYKIKGEGFFVSAVRKTAETGVCSQKIKLVKQTMKIPRKQLDEWFLSPAEYEYAPNADGMVLAYPKAVADAISFLKQAVRVVQSGVAVAQVKGNDLLPAAPFALSTAINEKAFATAELNWQDAMAFLKKESLLLPECPKGWVLVKHRGVRLGWVKNLGNRTNNAYPAEWHVRMQADEQQYTPIV